MVARGMGALTVLAVLCVKRQPQGILVFVCLNKLDLSILTRVLVSKLTNVREHFEMQVCQRTES